ncbi:MAG: hypothetical protein KatS3mg057_0808 [Herpetosiphonaceae bacterium]|nr:MAG: hypothetical protein KatS3mg057_0808 [Herpetosiphonaceae bacterium]
MTEALRQACLVGTAETLMVVRTTGQPRAKEQRMVAELRSLPIRVTYDQNVRRSGATALVTTVVWLLDVRLAPWVLLSDWSATTYREHGPFPPQFAAFLRGWRPDDEV